MGAKRAICSKFGSGATRFHRGTCTIAQLSKETAGRKCGYSYRLRSFRKQNRCGGRLFVARRIGRNCDLNLKNSTQRVSTVNLKSHSASAKKEGCAVEARTKKTVLDGGCFFCLQKNRGRQIVALSNVFYLCAQTPRVISLVNKALRVAFCCINFTALSRTFRLTFVIRRKLLQRYASHVQVIFDCCKRFFFCKNSIT